MINIKENIKPIFWGSDKWRTLFAIIAVYPDNPTKDLMCNVQDEFKLMECNLPCEGCRESYKIFDKENDTNIYDIQHFKSQKDLIQLVWNLRNKVNNKLGLEYNISLPYFRLKIKLMTCDDHHKDGIIWSLTEAPFIQKSMENKILKYLDDNKQYIPNYKKNYTRELLSIMKSFIEDIKETDFDFKNHKFKLWFKRNKKCMYIKNEIYTNMSCGNYDFVKAFKVDKSLFLRLFYLGCSIIPLEELQQIF
jgi:hypothetical protein